MLFFNTPILDTFLSKMNPNHIFTPDSFNAFLSSTCFTKSYTSECLAVVFYGCKNWSLTLREECSQRVFENRRIFGPKRDEETGEWRGLHNEKLYALYSSPNIILVIKSRKLKWAGHIVRMGETKDAYMV
jgi:hypothetical protein